MMPLLSKIAVFLFAACCVVAAIFAARGSLSYLRNIAERWYLLAFTAGSAGVLLFISWDGHIEEMEVNWVPPIDSFTCESNMEEISSNVDLGGEVTSGQSLFRYRDREKRKRIEVIDRELQVKTKDSSFHVVVAESIREVQKETEKSISFWEMEMQKLRGNRREIHESIERRNRVLSQLRSKLAALDTKMTYFVSKTEGVSQQIDSVRESIMETLGMFEQRLISRTEFSREPLGIIDDAKQQIDQMPQSLFAELHNLQREMTQTLEEIHSEERHFQEAMSNSQLRMQQFFDKFSSFPYREWEKRIAIARKKFISWQEEINILEKEKAQLQGQLWTEIRASGPGRVVWVEDKSLQTGDKIVSLYRRDKGVLCVTVPAEYSAGQWEIILENRGKEIRPVVEKLAIRPETADRVRVSLRLSRLPIDFLDMVIRSGQTSCTANVRLGNPLSFQQIAAFAGFLLILALLLLPSSFSSKNPSETPTEIPVPENEPDFQPGPSLDELMPKLIASIAEQMWQNPENLSLWKQAEVFASSQLESWRGEVTDDQHHAFIRSLPQLLPIEKIASAEDLEQNLQNYLVVRDIASNFVISPIHVEALEETIRKTLTTFLQRKWKGKIDVHKLSPSIKNFLALE